MLHGIAREVRYAGQTKLKLTQMHGKGHQILRHIDLITKFLNKIKTYAERLLSRTGIWTRILSEIFSNFLKGRILGEGSGKNSEQSKVACSKESMSLEHEPDGRGHMVPVPV